ncbi:MAG: cytochrome C [Nitrospirae bacterium]|nr:cytochrome C [Nitrospirota bacterium]
MKKQLLFLSILVLFLLTPSKVHSFDLLKGVMPGEVASLHQKIEGNCLECHTIGQKFFFDKCLVCHKEAKRDVDQKRGFHGKIDATKCEICHSDHKGRVFELVDLKKDEFDHRKTEFDLEGKHQKADCDKCHKKPKYRETQKECSPCHIKDDYHKEALGKNCKECHNAKSWKEAKFDHATTHFPLIGRHVTGKQGPVVCEKCHTAQNFTKTPKECFSCHEKEDKHKGSLGKVCESCHTAREWKEIKFDHSKTDFPLVGKHEEAKCEKCHQPQKKFKETPKACFSCHQKEDKHKGSLGKNCETCHTAREWKEIKFDHNKTDFKLEGKHIDTKCEKCHLPLKKVKEAPKTCIGCHLKEDKHKGNLGKDCETCHTAKTWKEQNFDHNKFEYKLVGTHQKVECIKCHQTPQLKQTPKLCYDCHKKDDYHKEKLGPKCDRCHQIVPKWKEIRFDHSTTKYPLVGKHIPVLCSKCHANEKYKISIDCISCHQKDDKHRGKLGESCARCHTENSWKEIDKFNHKKTNFPLEGKHIETKCALCHKTQLFKDAPRLCIDCHKKDDEHKGLFGKKCEACHTAKTWEREDFNHFKETGYPLLDKHRNVKCPECHTQTMFVAKTSRMCVSCHRRDDIHDGELGQRCEICHSEIDFKVIKKDSSLTR